MATDTKRRTKFASPGKSTPSQSMRNRPTRNRARPANKFQLVSSRGTKGGKAFQLSRFSLKTSRILIFRHLRIDAVRPGQNPAGQVMYFLESRLAQKIH